MRVFFKDEVLDGQLLRALNHVYYGGADIGECLTTAGQIAPGDLQSWYAAWMQTANRLWSQAEASLACGHKVSAREAFLRASTYYRTAGIFLLAKPQSDQLVEAYDKQRVAFQKAGALFTPGFEPIQIPYEATTLAGYFFRAAEDVIPRPTLILTGGYDSTAEELYFFNVAAALRRGYNCLCFDGPGQGHALIKQGLHFRPDWEKVVSPVVDYALTRPEVDRQRLALMGLSFGGYLAPRAASGEPRLAACIADPGELDLFEAVAGRMPPFLAGPLRQNNPTALKLVSIILNRLIQNPTRGWAIRRGLQVHGAATALDYVQLTRDYTIRDRAAQIKCPTLVCFAENDALAAYAHQLYAALTCPKHFLTFTSAEGAGEHCEDGNRSLFHQRAFDWLDETLHLN